MSYIHPVDRQQYVMMNCLDDLVPPDHPVRVIDAFISLLVLQNPERFGSEDLYRVGRPEYASEIFLKLYLYGYFNGVFSSRKLQTETERNIEVIWLLGKLSPEYWVISEYRKNHGDDIKFVTHKFREFLSKEGYLTGKRVAIDGSKIKANAKREMLTMKKIEKRLSRLDSQLEEYFQILATNDCREEVLEELEAREEVSDREALLINKLVTLQQEIETLKTHQASLEQSGRSAISSTDPEASLMRSRDGKHPGYNVQLAVDDQYGLIAGSDVLTDTNDHHALPVVLTSLKKELDIEPEVVLLDAGYYTPSVIEQVETTSSTKCYVAIPKKPKREHEISFTYDQEVDAYRCSAGKLLPLHQRAVRKRGNLMAVYRGIECTACTLKQWCTKSKKGRTVRRYENQQWRDEYIAKMSTKAARMIRGLRKTLAEHPFGFIKCLGGKIPILLRGRKKVTTEINFYTTAFNLKRICNLEAFDTLMEKITLYKWKTA